MKPFIAARVVQLPKAERLAIARNVLAEASATHLSTSLVSCTPNPFAQPQAFLKMRQAATERCAEATLVDASHAE